MTMGGRARKRAEVANGDVLKKEGMGGKEDTEILGETEL